MKNHPWSQRLATGIVLILIVPLLITPISSGGAQTTSDDVSVVHDDTPNAECSYRVKRNDNDYSDPRACRPGTILTATLTTAEDATGGQFGEVVEVVPVTDDEAADEAAVQEAMEAVADYYAPPSGQAGCFDGSKRIYFTFRVGPEKADVQLRYELRGRCQVFDIQDRARARIGSIADIDWLRSCVQKLSGPRSCGSRPGYLNSAEWTRWYPLANTVVGKRWDIDMRTCTTGRCQSYSALWYLD